MNGFFKKYIESMKQFKKINMSSLFEGLSHGEASTMMCIKCGNEDGRKAKVSDLSRDTKVNFASMSRTLRGLEEKGLIVRTISSEDRRIIYVDLTKKGMEMMEKIQVSMDSVTEKITEKMGKDNMEMLTSLLDKLATVSIEVVDEAKKERGTSNE